MNLSPTQVGAFFTIVPLLMFALSPVIGRLYDHSQGDYATIGLLLCAIACIIQSVASFLVNITAILLAFALRGFGCGFFQSPNNTRILTSLPPDKTAVSSSIASTARSFGIGLGVSFASIIMTQDMAIAGYHGPVLLAGPEIIAHSSGFSLLLGGLICIIAVAISRRWHGREGEEIRS